MLGANAIELARLNQRSQQCPILGALVATSERGVFGIELDRPHRTLDRIRIHLNAPVIKIERQAVPMTQRIAQSLRRVALLRRVIKLYLKPLFQGCSQRPGMRLSARAALGIRSATQCFLDGAGVIVEPGWASVVDCHCNGLPFSGLVTVNCDPNGSVRCAAVHPSLSKA